jgi:hypothetical protein
MIYEMRTYRLYPGKVPDFMRILEEGLPVREKHSKLVGMWSTEIGELNQVVHLWKYKDMAERAQVRQGLREDQEWHKIAAKLDPLIMKMENKILTTAPFSPMQ